MQPWLLFSVRSLAVTLVVLKFNLIHAQWGGIQLPPELNNILTGVSNMLAAQNSGVDNFQDSSCTPFKLPDQFESYQDFCRYLSELPDEKINDMFRNGKGPKSKKDPFPLKGCVLGCIIGQDSYRTGMMWGSGSWSGKCVRGKKVMNLLTPLPSLGGAMTVMDTFNWEDGLFVQERFPGDITTDWSWWDAFNGLSQTGVVRKRLDFNL
jgi:hypothetical protein